MKNFHLNAQGRSLLSGPAYLTAWNARLGEQTQRLGAYVRALWSRFNEDRASLDKHYMDDAKDVDAYLAAFVLPNCERTFSILTSARARESLVRAARARKQDELRVLDFGCGPLSASVGALAALDTILDPADVPRQVTVIGVDRSETIFGEGVRLLEAGLAPAARDRVSVARVPTIDKAHGSFDLILCANVFNEIPPKHRVATAEKLIERLAPGGVLLILEPGQDVHARALGVLRDAQLTAHSESADVPLRVLGPCMHEKACPLSARSDRKDWCWFQHGWEPPEKLVAIDRFARLSHEDLNFSFVLFAHDRPESLAGRPFARVVSSPIHLAASSGDAFHKTARYAATNPAAHVDPQTVSRVFDAIATAHGELEKLILCTRDGALEAAFSPGSGSGRGSIVESAKDFPARAKERFTLTPGRPDAAAD